MHDQRRVRDLFYVRRSAIQNLINQVLLSHNADDLVDRPAANQKLSVRARSNSVEDLLLATVEVHPLHARPRCHDCAHRAIGEVENTLDHIALDIVDHPQSGALRDEVVNVILGQGAFEARAQMQQAEEEARGLETVGSPVYPLAEGHSHDHGDGHEHSHAHDEGDA